MHCYGVIMDVSVFGIDFINFYWRNRLENMSVGRKLPPYIFSLHVSWSFWSIFFKYKLIFRKKYLNLYRKFQFLYRNYFLKFHILILFHIFHIPWLKKSQINRHET